MANLFFPQLTSGALAQYPIRKTRLVRTIKNQLPDGNMLLYADAGGSKLLWQLEYVELSSVDLQSLQSHFFNCIGPFRGFTFIDPTDNMLACSSDLTNPIWIASASLQVNANTSDPVGSTAAFTLVNNSQLPQSLTQTLAVPANYQYCFSVYVRSSQGATITLAVSGASANAAETFAADGNWKRIFLDSQLNDAAATFLATISLGLGQQADVYGPQLEPQLVPSQYRPTLQQGGVYPNAHWGADQLPVIATAPGMFSTSFSIETSL
jgi:hypothetical protein